MRYVSTAAALLLLMTVSLGAQSFRLDAGPTGSVAEEKPPVIGDEGLERIELVEPGTLTKSNALYVLTKDVSAPGTVFTVAAGVRNTVLDLGGHVVTYNAEKQPLVPGKPYGECVYGVHVTGRGIESVVIRNGVIVQGAGANAGSHAICLSGGKAIEIHHIQSRVHGPSTSNVSVAWGGPDGRVHDNYFENHSTTLRGGLFASNGIVLSQTQPGWEIWNNTIIGAHNSIAVWNNATKEQRSAARIHHNRLSPKRIHGVKAPQGIMCFGSAGNEIFENEISTDDARGINLQGRGSGHNHVHHNLIACRYSTKATEGNYVENRCYGYWERDGAANRLVDNVWIVGNEVMGDRTSNTVGILATTTGGRLPSAEYARNRIICTHADPDRDVLGFEIKRSDKDVVLDGNEIVARIAAVRVFGESTGVQFLNNVCLHPAGNANAALFDGDDVDKCTKKDNVVRALAPAATPPAAPLGLRTVPRHEAIELRWNPSPEKDVVGYHVTCDGKRLNPFTVGGRFFVHLGVKPGETHRYEVSAVTLAGVESPRSPALLVTQK